MGLTGGFSLTSSTIEPILEALKELFPSVDLGGQDMMAEMYNMIEATPLQLSKRLSEPSAEHAGK
jgi:hypothetical protein